MKRVWKTIAKSTILLFALVGGLFTFVFIGEQVGLFSVRGSATQRNSFFQEYRLHDDDTSKNTLLCKIRVLSGFAPLSASTFLDVYNRTGDEELLSIMLSMASRRFYRTDIVKHYDRCLVSSQYVKNETQLLAFAWAETPQWSTLKSAFAKDVETIQRVSEETGIESRIIVASAVPEQLRFFSSNRESFKKYFEPLKILGTLSQFSLGITGIKPDTAVRIEHYANDTTSVYYPGEDIAQLLVYGPEENHDAVLLDRLTNPEDHYYQYLYTAIYIKEIIQAWTTAGFPIDDDPGVLVTLFNLGFDKSNPHSAPETGGATVVIEGETYTFGQLGEEFYYSGELANLFPYKTH